MATRPPSRRRREKHPTEDVGGQLLLSFDILESLLPIGGSQLEDALGGPSRQEAEQIADVGERLDPVEPGAGQERDEDGVDLAPVLATDEDPIAATKDLAAQVQLADVVAHRQSPVVEESAQGYALVERIADAGGHRRFVQDELGLRFAPREELVDDRSRLGAPDRFFLRSWKVRDGPLDAEQGTDP